MGAPEMGSDWYFDYSKDILENGNFSSSFFVCISHWDS